MNVVKRGLFVFVVGLVFLVGCVPMGQPFSPIRDISTEQAVIYLYRPYNMVGGGKLYTVLVDGQTVGKLVNGAYLPLLVARRTHKVELKQDSVLIRGDQYEVTVTPASSKVLYLRFGSMWAAGQAQLMEVDGATAMPELEKCKKY